MFGFLRRKGGERRLIERLPLPDKVAQMVVRSHNTKERVHLRLVDVSERGVRFVASALDGTLPRDEELEIQLTIPQGTLQLSGKVVWSKPLNGGTQYEGGILFDPLPARKHDVIAAFVEHVRLVAGHGEKRIAFPEGV